MVVYLLCQVPFYSFHYFNQLNPRWTFGGGWVFVMKVFDIRSGLDVAPDWWQNWFWQVLVLKAPISLFCKNHSYSLGLSLCVPYKQKRKRKRTCKGTQRHAREHSPNTLSRHPLMLMSKANAPGPCTGNVYQSLRHLDLNEKPIGWIHKLNLKYFSRPCVAPTKF